MKNDKSICRTMLKFYMSTFNRKKQQLHLAHIMRQSVVMILVVRSI